MISKFFVLNKNKRHTKKGIDDTIKIKRHKKNRRYKRFTIYQKGENNSKWQKESSYVAVALPEIEPK